MTKEERRKYLLDDPLPTEPEPGALSFDEAMKLAKKLNFFPPWDERVKEFKHENSK